MRTMEFNDPTFNSKRSFYNFLSEMYNEVASLFKEVGNSQKIRILTILHKSAYSFSELINETGLQGSTLSNYLNSLIDSKLLEKVERGYYAITFKGADLLETVAHQYLKIKLDEENQFRYAGTEVKPRVSRFILGDYQVSDDITIKKIEPMLVAAIHSLAKEPEDDVWNKMKAWATQEEIFNDPNHPIYGFNHPVEGKHGYELWIKVDSSTEPSGEIAIKKFEGGEFGVLKCHGVSSLGQAWKDLVNWRQRMGYKVGNERCFEHNLNFGDDGEKIEFELYLPIKKK